MPSTRNRYAGEAQRSPMSLIANDGASTAPVCNCQCEATTKSGMNQRHASMASLLRAHTLEPEVSHKSVDTGVTSRECQATRFKLGVSGVQAATRLLWCCPRTLFGSAYDC